MGRPWGLQLRLKVSFKHLWTLPWAPGSHHHLKQKHGRQRGSSKARVSQGATALQVVWQSSLQKILAAWGRAEGFRSIHPFRGRRSTDTRHTMFSLWGNSIWKHYWEKESTETSLYFCEFFFHVRISELTMIFTQSNKWLVYDVEQPQTSKATSATPNIPHVKITTETWHKISWSSNRVERSTVRTDAGRVNVVSEYLPESQRSLQGWGREGI